jgi:hypothetical protein
MAAEVKTDRRLPFKILAQFKSAVRSERVGIPECPLAIILPEKFASPLSAQVLAHFNGVRKLP